MRFGHGQHERLLEQEFRVQLVVRHRQRQQPRVQLALAQPRQQHIALLLDQQQFQVREARADARHHMRQQVGPQRGEHSQPDGAGLGVLAAAGGFLHLLDLGHDAARALGGIAAGRCQHDLARRALHQRHAQFVLQLLDLGGERGLADVARGGGTTEMLVVGQGHQVLQVAQIHRNPPSRSAERRGRTARAMHHAATASAVSTGAEVRIRWSKALRAAFEPSPMAMTICL